MTIKKSSPYYRVCQGLWPSLTFADEDIIHFCSNYIGWSNQGKYYEIEMHCAKQDVAHDFMIKQIFFRSIFLSENTGQLA
jgi:hypothetical protein